MNQDQNNKDKDKEKDFIKDDGIKDRHWAMLAYIIFLIPLLAGPKESKFVRYHLNQGILLTITAIGLSVVVGIALSVLTGIVTINNPFGILWIMPVYTILRLACAIVIIIFLIIGIVNASKGELKPLPVIGGFKILTV